MLGAPAEHDVKMADRDRVDWNNRARGAAGAAGPDVDFEVCNACMPIGPSLYVQSVMAGRPVDRRIDRLAIDDGRIGAAIERVAHGGHVVGAAAGGPGGELER